MRTRFLGTVLIFGSASILALIAGTPVMAGKGHSHGHGGGGDGGGGAPTCLAPTSSPACSLAAGAANASAFGANVTGSLDPGAVSGAILVGYNWQVGTVVYGLESDFGWFNLGGMRQVSASYPMTAPSSAGRSNNIYTVGTSFQSNSLVTLRGRLGFAESNVLPYLTGGLALTGFWMPSSFADTVGGLGAFGSASNSDQRTGWTVGGGLEWAVNDHLSVKGEYLFVNLGRIATSIAPGFAGIPSGLGVTSDLNLHVARAGLNYKF
jgi:outer membrane immunogenic protein